MPQNPLIFYKIYLWNFNLQGERILDLPTTANRPLSRTTEEIRYLEIFLKEDCI
jgi:hypothetical protein